LFRTKSQVVATRKKTGPRRARDKGRKVGPGSTDIVGTWEKQSHTVWEKHTWEKKATFKEEKTAGRKMWWR